MNKITLKRSIVKKDKDEKEYVKRIPNHLSFSSKIDKLKQVNIKLRQRLKELNGQLEKTIEKANSRKI